MVTKYMDYLANPNVKIKHREVFEVFFNNYNSVLEKDESAFKTCQAKIAALAEECYCLGIVDCGRDALDSYDYF